MSRLVALLLAPLVFVGCGSSTERNTERSTAAASSASHMPNVSKIIFDGHEFRIVKAEIEAFLADPYWCNTYNKGQGKKLSWSISFETASDDPDFAPPSFEFDGLPIDVKNWPDLVGYRARWNDPIGSDFYERRGSVYVYDHQLISDGSVQVTARSGTKFQIKASGKNEEGQSFTIDAPAEFKGVSVHGSEKDTEETIRTRLKQAIIDADLLQSAPFELDNKYQSGVRMGRAYFRPVIK